jgi:hypothetical protein
MKSIIPPYVVHTAQSAYIDRPFHFLLFTFHIPWVLWIPWPFNLNR